ncbi:tetratricopeptide repeat protein [Planococcus salinarum]|uniref:tetratricopeptide repeat protein n=1 Tax=Planococcus salinarum TaxID=622695 RepID=UPI000E3CC30E|nr:hypothetical protein [Planococcus salinarum]TAA72446.1 hypothetical protein D2909_06735 [Planococcus salinarum]
MGYFQDLFNEFMKMKWLKEADVAQDKGDIAKAIRAYSKLIEINCYSAKDVSNFYEFRADLNFKEYDDRESAFIDLNHSIVNNPSNDRSIAKQGILWYLLNEFEKAGTSAQKALDLNSTNETALMLLDWINDNKETQN